MKIFYKYDGEEDQGIRFLSNQPCCIRIDFLKFKLMSSVHYCDQRKSTQLSKIFKIPQDSQTDH